MMHRLSPGMPVAAGAGRDRPVSMLQSAKKKPGQGPGFVACVAGYFKLA
jgi:hypothetical protein